MSENILNTHPSKSKRIHKSASQWHNILEQQRASGLSIRQFCMQHKIQESSFYRWRNRFCSSGADKESPSTARPSFAELSLTGSPQSHIEVRRGEITISLLGVPDPRLLQAAVVALGALPC